MEAGRGLAAVAVVLFHANITAAQIGGPNLVWMTSLQHGVDFFFVLSGFIILHTHRRDIDHPASLRDYALKRCIRLLPLLFVVVLAWWALRHAAGDGDSVALLVRSLFPYPSLAPAQPVVVWTLRHEVVFYALFATLLLSFRLGLAVFAGWTLLTLAQFIAVAVGHPAQGLAAFFISGFTIQFLLGMAIALLPLRAPPSARPLAFSLLALCLIVFAMRYSGPVRLATNDYSSFGATWGTALLGVSFAGVLLGLLRVEGLWPVPRLFRELGAASYAIYLVHTPVNAALQQALHQLPARAQALGASQLLLIIAGVVAGVLIHKLIEAPLLRFLRHWLLPSQQLNRHGPPALPISPGSG